MKEQGGAGHESRSFTDRTPGKSFGLANCSPGFSWHTDGGLQSAYEIIVRNGKTAVWKSGKVTTGHMLARCGYDAAPREHLTWRIRLWDENDQPGEWNDAWFEMGLLQASSTAVSG